MNIFDWLNEISYNKRDWNEFTPEQQASFDPYMIHRFISMKQEYCELVSELHQSIGALPNKYIYKIWSNTIPKRKTFFKYIKAKRPLPNDKLLIILANHWRVSKREIKDNYHLISKNYIEHLLYELGIDGRKHKTYLK
jgi:hypothetical protein